MRTGDTDAFGELYRRHHKAARSTARSLLRSRTEADDVVSDSFAGVLAAIRRGKGPREDFRRYLLATVRNGCRARRFPVPVGDVDGRPSAASDALFEDPERFVDADTVARAFASLRPRWQQTLWLTEVEQRSTVEVGELLDLSPNATAALTLRARDALATAYLAEHVGAAPSDECERLAPRLAAYVRGQLTPAQRADVEAHVVTCGHCSAALRDLRDLNASLRTLTPATAAIGGSLTTPSTIGFSISAMPTGILSGSLLLKGAAIVLVVTPVVVTQLPDGDGAPGAAQSTVVEVQTPSGATAAQPPAAASVPGSAVTVIADTTTTTTTTTSAAAAQPTVTTPDGDDAEAAPVLPPESMPPTTAGPPPTASSTVTVTVPSPTAPAQATGPVIEPIVGLVDELVGVVVPTLDSVLTASLVAVGGAVDTVLAPVSALLQTLEPAVTIAVELPPITVPPITVPPISVPPLTLPAVSVPPLGVPGVTLSPATVPPPPTPPPPPQAPPPTLPPASVPPTAPGNAPAPTPAVTPAPVTIPPVTIPPITLPPVTIPSISLPPVTLPPLTVPPITLPEVTLPSLTLPRLGQRRHRSGGRRVSTAVPHPGVGR